MHHDSDVGIMLIVSWLQSFAAGVGNWVADEVLYQARLHPEQLVDKMTSEHISQLHSALHDVIHTAVRVRAVSEKYPPDWLFHNRYSLCKPVFSCVQSHFKEHPYVHLSTVWT